MNLLSFGRIETTSAMSHARFAVDTNWSESGTSKENEKTKKKQKYESKIELMQARKKQKRCLKLDKTETDTTRTFRRESRPRRVLPGNLGGGVRPAAGKHDPM